MAESYAGPAARAHIVAGGFVAARAQGLARGLESQPSGSRRRQLFCRVACAGCEAKPSPAGEGAELARRMRSLFSRCRRAASLPSRLRAALSRRPLKGTKGVVWRKAMSGLPPRPRARPRIRSPSSGFQSNAAAGRRYPTLANASPWKIVGVKCWK